MSLTPMQVKFLLFSIDHPVFVFNGSCNPNLPAKGAVARTVADSLVKRSYISRAGMITPLGKRMLEAQLAIPPLDVVPRQAG